MHTLPHNHRLCITVWPGRLKEEQRWIGRWVHQGWRPAQDGPPAPTAPVYVDHASGSVHYPSWRRIHRLIDICFLNLGMESESDWGWEKGHWTGVPLTSSSILGQGNGLGRAHGVVIPFKGLELSLLRSRTVLSRQGLDSQAL